MNPVIELIDVCKSFTVGRETVTAVDHADLAVEPGELACVYGASGSGKTTMLSIMAGIDVADAGVVRVAGHDLTGLSEGRRADVRLRGIGVVFQSDNLLPEFTALENVVLPLLVRGVARDEADDLAHSALASVGLSALASRLPGHVSGGQRQRMGIARALAGGQSVLLADEPTGALDSDTSRHLFALIRSLCDDRGTAVVITTHDPLAHGFATSVHDMVDGMVSRR